MAIQPVQLNKNIQNPGFKQDYKSYLEADGTIKTDNNVKPLPPKGHLVDDDFGSSVKYFFKDIGYDMKSVKNGFNGSANDHQLGRLNDVGLRLGGIGIAAYLASRTTNPKVRIMEYVGLATFLTSMAIYPKLAINTPARILHGYDFDKEYIDDQGRKKSVQQDSNYVPYDMYMGANSGEDLDTIGDKMGIPRDIKNRHDLIREQMRKIATQNNTLWMLTAGFATPLMTALLCNGFENWVVSPALEKARNAKFNKQISEVLEQTKEMTANIEEVENSLARNVERLLSGYKNQVLPNDEYESVIRLITDGLDSNIKEGVRADLEKVLSNKGVVLNHQGITDMIDNAAKQMKGRNLDQVKSAILPTAEDVKLMIASIKTEAHYETGVTLTEAEFAKLKELMNTFIDSRIAQTTTIPQNILSANKSHFLNALQVEKSNILSEADIAKAVDFAKIMGDFKEKQVLLDACKNFKFEHAPETILARYYGKFQDALVKELGISSKDYKRMRDDKEFTRKILDEKIKALCENEEQYKKTFEKLSKIMQEMEEALHSTKEESQIKDLITAIENTYNQTAIRLNANGIGKNTIDRLVKEDVATLGNSVHSNEELRALLDGVTPDLFKGGTSNWVEVAKYNAKGKGSSKNLEISRLISRYQGETNSFNRILHTLDFYKRAANPEELMRYTSLKDGEFMQEIAKIGKEALLSGTSSDYTLKFNMENNPMGYRDLVNTVWASDEASEFWQTQQKGKLSSATEEGMAKSPTILEKLKVYITRVKNLIGNNKTDFKKPDHILHPHIQQLYTQSEKTNEALFNLVGQNPVDMMQKAAARKHGDGKWLKIVGGMTAAVFGVTMLAQFGFGKIRNPHNIQKQVDDGTNK